MKVGVAVPGVPVPNGPYGLTEQHVSDLRSCVKVEMAVPGSPSLMVLTVSLNNTCRISGAV